MRREPNPRIDKYRATHPVLGDSPAGTNWGWFLWGELRIMSSGADSKTGWEHVSVSCVHRTPTWDEMCKVKELFWADDETVLQFHPLKAEYINQMRYCLHLWKQCGVNHSLPPAKCV